MQPFITPALFEFFRELAENNDREWFNAQKPRYERDVVEPLMGFITAFKPHLAAISPHFAAIAKKQGGSMFRIYRDTRFSHDKRPYKTHAGIHFRHESAEDAYAPGIYLHLEPGQVFFGAGIWHPEPAVASLIRQAIVARPEDWRAALEAPGFAGRMKLAGESLKRPPAGYPADHPLIEDLKRKDFICSRDLDEATACRSDFLDVFVDLVRGASPFTRFVTEACGARF